MANRHRGSRLEFDRPASLLVGHGDDTGLEGQSMLIGFENGMARLATLPIQIPEEQVPDWLATPIGTNLNPRATVDFLKHEE
jgi:hypothetical protein